MNDQQTLAKLIRIEANVEAMTEALKRIADKHDEELDEHKEQLRELGERLRALEHSNERLQAITKLVMWLGAPGTAAVVVFIASKWN